MERAVHRTTMNRNARLGNLASEKQASGTGVPSYREKIHVDDVGVPFFHPFLYFYC